MEKVAILYRHWTNTNYLGFWQLGIITEFGCQRTKRLEPISGVNLKEFLDDKDVSKANFTLHQQWSNQGGWKSTLNNLRLIIQPITLLWLIFPWLDIFPNRQLLLGFHQLIALMNQFSPFELSG